MAPLRCVVIAPWRTIVGDRGRGAIHRAPAPPLPLGEAPVPGCLAVGTRDMYETSQSPLGEAPVPGGATRDRKALRPQVSIASRRSPGPGDQHGYAAYEITGLNRLSAKPRSRVEIVRTRDPGKLESQSPLGEAPVPGGVRPRPRGAHQRLNRLSAKPRSRVPGRTDLASPGESQSPLGEAPVPGRGASGA